MLKNAVRLLAGGLVTCLAQLALAQSQSPLLPWRTLDTDHFHIHFVAHDEASARALAVIAEQQYVTITRALDWRPDRKTHVRLVDNSDRPQGHANVIPFPQTEILLAPPDDGELVSSDDWLTLVFSHELAHVIHLDKSRSTPNGLQDLFGRHPWLFPARMQPGWGIEGFAVYWESQVNRDGRAASPWYDMLMRLEVDNGLKSLATINSPAYTSPRNQAYLYGSYFFLFLDDVYGRDTVFRLINEYSDNLVPYRLVSNSARVTGKPLPQLWRQFEGWLRQRFNTQIETGKAQGLSAFTSITTNGFAHDNPLVAADGALWFIENDGHRAPHLVRIHDDKREIVAELENNARFTLHPQRGVLIAQPEMCGAYSVYYDLFQIKPGSTQPQRLTHCGRYRLAAWSPDGSTIAAVQHIAGKPILVLLNADGSPRETLLTAAPGDIIGALDWHGDMLAITQQHKTQWDIRRFDIRNRSWHQLTDDKAIERNLRFDRDGTLLYSADYRGNFEIYRLAADFSSAAQLTRGIGAAIAPGGSDDTGHIYYTGFAADGQHIYRAKNNVLENIPLRHTAATSQPDNITVETPAPPSTNYNGWYSIAPTSWEPYWQTTDGINAFGATVFGQDALGLHQYRMSLLRESDLAEYLGSINYSFADQLFLSTTRQLETVKTSNNEIDYYRTEIESQMLYSYPFGTLEGVWRAGFGYSFENDELKSRDGTVSQVKENVVGAHVSFSSVEYFPLQYGASEGRSIGLVIESYDTLRNNDFSGEVFSLDWHEYIAVGDNTLALRWVEGIGSEKPTSFQLGGVFSEYEGLAPYINQRKYALRGYNSLRALADRHMRLGTFEWRMPLRHINRSLMVPPIGVGRTSMALFSDIGGVWHNGENPDRYYSSVGIEAIGELVLGYNLLLDARVGFARGLDDDLGESQFYMRFGRAF
jgi:hypothetical protein